MFLESLDEQHVGGAPALGEADELNLIIFNIGSELVDLLALTIDGAWVVEARWAVGWWLRRWGWFILDFYIIFSRGFL
jgi:hypothetical protein